MFPNEVLQLEFNRVFEQEEGYKMCEECEDDEDECEDEDEDDQDCALFI